MGPSKTKKTKNNSTPEQIQKTKKIQKTTESNPLADSCLDESPASLRRVERRIEPKSNQRKEVQVTSLACVPDKCLATEGHQPERYPQPPTRMNLHPTTLLY